MNPQKHIANSNPPSAALTALKDNAPNLTHYPADDGHRTWLVLLIILLGLGGAALAFAQETAAQAQTRARQYRVTELPALGGTSSRGNSINNRDWVAGSSNLAGDQRRHAVLWRPLWRNGSILDLGTLGGPNSNVTWSVKNDRGIIIGISQTATPEPLGENWSSAAFYPAPDNVGYINLGFVWERGQMRALPTLGGNNGFATGGNNRAQAVGWAENTCHDATCVPPQVLQFRPVLWELGRHDAIHEFPLISGDTSGAATAINDKGEAVGISGICDQAIGRHTARHAVLWEDDRAIDIGNLGAPWWNTPTAINQRGDIVGFAGDPAFPEGDILHAFIRTKYGGIRPLGALPGHVHSEAYGINERRQVVGVSCDADFADCRAFVWDDGVMTDLNARKQADYPARLEQAKDINEEGEITGRAIDPATGVRTAFVAKPVRRQDLD